MVGAAEGDRTLRRARRTLFNPASTAIASQFVSSAEAAAPKVGLEAFEARIHEPAEIDSTMLRLGREPGTALIVLPDTFLSFHHKLIVELANRYQLPTMYPFRYFVAAGGLISYGPDLSDQFRRAAGYIDRIFRGEKPAVLPVQQPTKFEFVINVKTAKSLRLTVPLTLQVAADEVIE
jgi:putative ABC transport system substrate-binding protein